MEHNTRGNVLEGNKKIAEFMGAIWKKDDYGADGYTYNESKPPTGIGSGYEINALKYHSSWEWLMPVWKKLGDLLYKNTPRNNQELYIRAHEITSMVILALREVDIERAFLWIIEGIDWYNNNVSKQQTNKE